jgi:hypothetical protein
MPQLDKLTYFNQVVSVLSIFLAFYILTVHKILPQIAKVLKTRKKLINSFNALIKKVSEEKDVVENSINQEILKGISQSTSTIQKTLNKGVNWYGASMKDINNKLLISANKNYISYLINLEKSLYTFANNLEN